MSHILAVREIQRKAAKALGWVFVLACATSVSAQSSAIEFVVTGEHVMASGDTPDSARPLALADARWNAWQTAVSRLQSRDDVKALRLSQVQLEAFTTVLLDIGEEPATTSSTATRGSVQARVRGSMDPTIVVKRMAALRNDQDASYDVVEAWTEM